MPRWRRLHYALNQVLSVLTTSMHIRSRFSLRLCHIQGFEYKYQIQFFRHFLLFQQRYSQHGLCTKSLITTATLSPSRTAVCLMSRSLFWWWEEDNVYGIEVADLAGCVLGFQKKEGPSLVIMTGFWQNWEWKINSPSSISSFMFSLWWHIFKGLVAHVKISRLIIEWGRAALVIVFVRSGRTQWKHDKCVMQTSLT